MRISDTSIDILWTSDGDIFFDDVKEDLYMCAAREDEILTSSVVKRLASTNGNWITNGDWRHHPHIGNDLYKYLGARSTQTILNELRDDIAVNLVSDGLISANDLNVDVLPIDPHTLLVLIFCQSLVGDEPILVSFDFSLTDHGVATVTDPKGSEFKSHLRFRNVE